MSDILFDEDDVHHGEFYCRHGVFIGNPYGGDYMCGWCESGDEPPTQAELDRWRIEKAEAEYDRIVASLTQSVEMGDLAWQAVLGYLVTDICQIMFWRDVKLMAAWDRQHG